MKGAHWDFHKMQVFLAVKQCSIFMFSDFSISQSKLKLKEFLETLRSERMTTIWVLSSARWGEVQTASGRPARIAEPGRVSDPLKK